ncbi:PD-(D/E)XK nuclease family protein [Sulfobacillus sp. hq2]|uniref:RecB family exonuclease n=1 Tax=Sulfobacillus TaxID=28033 RepID=UPI000CD0CC87|nr:PD-(D/E)XK nuclease family protein [Sulfobacillus sp. hq2]POB09993.1 hypothetical protein CO251_12325 [Sulfobacillus sp. hq2]
MVRLVLGSASDLLERLTNQARQQTQPWGLVVPNQTLAVFLSDQLRQPEESHLPEIISLWDLARSLLPQGVHVAPIGMEKALAFLLARDFAQSLPLDVPGIYLSIVRHALELRRRHISLPASGGIDWPRITQWLEGVIPTRVYDELRVYQYAQTVKSVRPWQSLVLYGYVEAHAAQWQFIKALAARYPLTVYTPWLQHYSNQLAEPWVNAWREEGAVIEEIPAHRSSARELGVRVRKGTPLLEKVAGHLQAQGAEDHLLIVTGQEPEPLLQFAKRRGVVVAEDAGPYRLARNVWQAFWRIVRHTHDDADHRNWLEVMAVHGTGAQEAGQFAQRWSEDIHRASSWTEVVALVQQAAAFHGLEALTRSLKGADDWALFDHWPWRPNADLLDEMWALLPFQPAFQRAQEGLRWAYGLNARLLTASVITVVAAEEGTFPRAPSPDPLWPAHLAQDFGLPASTHGRDQDLHLMHLLQESGARELWWFGYEDGNALWPIGINPEPVSINPKDLKSVRPEDDGRSALWYRSHYDSKAFDDYTGRIGTDVAQELVSLKASPSALEAFGTCPLAFFYGRVLQIPADSPEDGLAVPAALRGQWVHAVLEKMVTYGQELTLDVLYAWVNEVSAMDMGSGSPVGPVLENARDDIVRELWQVWPLVRPSKPFLTEYPVEFTVQARDVLWQLSGRIDRIDGWKTQELLITDYKTGTLSDPNHVRPDNLQMPLYRQALAQSVPGATVSARLFGVSLHNQFQEKVLDVAKMPRGRVENILAAMAQRMVAGDFLPLPQLTADPCRLCPYTGLCPGDIKAEARRKHETEGAYWTLWEDQQG